MTYAEMTRNINWYSEVMIRNQCLKMLDQGLLVEAGNSGEKLSSAKMYRLANPLSNSYVSGIRAAASCQLPDWSDEDQASGWMSYNTAFRTGRTHTRLGTSPFRIVTTA